MLELPLLPSIADYSKLHAVAKVKFCPPNPPTLGGIGFKVPQNWGMQGGVPGFMQEVYLCNLVLYPYQTLYEISFLMGADRAIRLGIGNTK